MVPQYILILQLITVVLMFFAIEMMSSMPISRENAKTNQKTAIIVICIETVCIILLTIALIGLLSSNFVLLPICVIVQMVMLLGSMWFVIKTYLLLNKVKKD